jgi:hypothetical protein
MIDANLEVAVVLAGVNQKVLMETELKFGPCRGERDAADMLDSRHESRVAASDEAGRVNKFGLR